MFTSKSECKIYINFQVIFSVIHTVKNIEKIIKCKSLIWSKFFLFDTLFFPNVFFFKDNFLIKSDEKMTTIIYNNVIFQTFYNGVDYFL